MKRGCLLLLTVFLVGCSESTEPEETTEAVKPAQLPAEVSVTADGYPIDFCVVSGEKLGSMGDPAEVTVENRLVKLCCASCETQLREDPAKYLAKLDAGVDTGVEADTDTAHDHAH